MDEIHQSEDTVTIDAKAGKLYYEGKLDSSVMPWNISIHVIQTESIRTAEDAVEQEFEHLNFVQKFLKLFGLYD